MSTKQIQALLTYLGYDPVGVDGIAGANTIAAVKAFQAAEGLTVDGDAGAATQAALLDAVANGRYRADTGGFWDKIRYFVRTEFQCQCGGKYCDGYPAEPAETLVEVAERVREHFGVPVTVSSGLRCARHNAEVGGVANSRHIIGHAMDFCVHGKTAAEVLPYVQAQPEIVYAYAINESFVHMDIGQQL